MTDPARERSSFVDSMRRIREDTSAQISDLSYDELVKWLRDGQYDDPVLGRLASRLTARSDTVARR